MWSVSFIFFLTGDIKGDSVVGSFLLRDVAADRHGDGEELRGPFSFKSEKSGSMKPLSSYSISSISLQNS